ncbi:MAG: hypothetical protein ACKVX9_12825, partial [Blastocatellia bacterium]
ATAARATAARATAARATAGGSNALKPAGASAQSTRTAAGLPPQEAPARGVGVSDVAGAVTGVASRFSNAILLSREDEAVQSEVREIILMNPATQEWDFNVKQGMVTVKVPPGHKANLGNVIAEIRKVAGVKSVFVISM